MINFSVSIWFSAIFSLLFNKLNSIWILFT
nr:MAG TPA: hypothetical protein [Crassvirales sp.]DAX04532.1 MAG TPA: hypothetical protein [Bacteriophage sp.]